MTSPNAFAQMLRSQRERRGVTLQTVADRTKIAPSMLKALERGDCSKWPGGIYSRAWIRAYADAIGLDPDEIYTDFAQVFSGVAFPEGRPASAPPLKTAELPRITPLRITIEVDPRERLRVLARRGALFAADLFLAGFTAAAVTVLTAFSFWTMFAAALVACHAIGAFDGGGSVAGLIERFVRRPVKPEEDAYELPMANFQLPGS